MNYLRFLIVSTALVLAVLGGGIFTVPAGAAQYAEDEDSQDVQEEMLYQEDENYQDEGEYLEEDEGQAVEGQESDEDSSEEDSEEEQ